MVRFLIVTFLASLVFSGGPILSTPTFAQGAGDYASCDPNFEEFWRCPFATQGDGPGDGGQGGANGGGNNGDGTQGGAQGGAQGSTQGGNQGGNNGAAE